MTNHNSNLQILSKKKAMTFSAGKSRVKKTFRSSFAGAITSGSFSTGCQAVDVTKATAAPSKGCFSAGTAPGAKCYRVCLTCRTIPKRILKIGEADVHCAQS